MMRKGILNGVRVTDLSMGWAGPMVSMMLADFGAEVIKIESRTHLDWWRASTKIPKGSERPYETSPVFNTGNRNKYDITLDLGNPECMEMFKDLVRISDIVLESFTPRVMKNLGLDYPKLRELNPSIIMVSMPAFGLSGPWKDYAGIGMTSDCMAGLPSVTGYEGGGPRLQPNAYGDPISGLNGAVAVMMALGHRRLTGQGQHIEVAHVEAVTHHMAGPLMDFAMNGRIQQRRGNQDAYMAPHGCYRCVGEDDWIAIAIQSDGEWQHLCQIMGRPDLASNPEYADSLKRWQNRKILDRLVESWTSTQNKQEVMKVLQDAGIAAGAALNNKEILEDVHLKARDFYQEIDRTYVGKHLYPGFVSRLSRDKATVFKAAPCLGEDNAFVMQQILGRSAEEVEALEREGVIGTTPLLK